MLLKAIGVNFTESHVKAIEAIIPQIPQKLNEAGAAVNAAITNFDARLKAIEESNQLIISWIAQTKIQLERLVELGEHNSSDRTVRPESGDNGSTSRSRKRS